MNIPMTWIKSYVDIDCDTKAFADAMTMSGSKVETIVSLGDKISSIVVGRIEAIEKHPDADKLVVTKVDVGTEKLQIVTGAANLTVGDYVPVALNGSVLADGSKIKKGKLRGVESNGMLCSIEELGYSRQDYPEAPEHGIYIFTEPQPLGADVRPILELCDDVVEFEITSNRPDCYSIVGLAREAAATFNKSLRLPVVALKEEGEGRAEDMIQVQIENPVLCPRYAARVVKDVTIGPSPQWMRHRLTAAGLRPINNIVDITNYVMLELGQPMHAFDIDNIAERKIIVRNAKNGEQFTTLDGVERSLDASMLVIADCQKAVAIGGIMGGENSKVTEGATAILFESANFNGPNIRISAKKLGLRTDASGKYEKGLDPNLSLLAVNRAVQLVEELGCGQVVPGVVDCYPGVREPWTVSYDPAKINAINGVTLSEEEIEGFLGRLEIKAKNGVAEIPTFRPDLIGQADLAEEVARMYGYDNIPVTLTTGTPTVGKKSRKQQLEDLIKNTMVSMGLMEALHYSFESPKVFDKLSIPEDSPLRRTVKITNPLGEDYSVMRTSTVNGILQSLSVNYNRRNEEAGLYELASVYMPGDLPLVNLPDEKPCLTLGMYGKVDFYDLKGIVEELIHVLGLADSLAFEVCSTLPYMHGGRTAQINICGKAAGYIGEVHPQVLSRYEIGTRVYLGVVDLEILYEKASMERSFKPLPKFPGMKRDIAMLVKDEVMVKDIEKIIRDNGTKLLDSVQLFDVYKGKQIEEGMKSVAYTITFLSPERTLKEEEVTEIMGKVLQKLEEGVGAQLRDK